MSNPGGPGMPTQKEPRAREREESERAEQEEKEGNRLPDDAVVDVEAEKREANSDEILDRLDEELVGLAPVETRIREIADLLVVDRLRQKFGIESTPAHPAHVLHRQPRHGEDHRRPAHARG